MKMEKIDRCWTSLLQFGFIVHQIIFLYGSVAGWPERTLIFLAVIIAQCAGFLAISALYDLKNCGGATGGEMKK